MDIDATQAINLSDFEDDTEGDTENQAAMGYLKVFSNRGFQEKVYPVFEGENFIGREESNQIVVPVKSLSKQHACIEVHADSHLIYDLNSRNKSRKGKMFLKPNVRYNMQHDDKFILADMACQYYFASEYNKKSLDSGSDTDSELMLDGIDSDSEKLIPQIEDHKESENSDYLNLSDCIQPTQAVDAAIGKNKTLEMKTPSAPKAGGILATESDEEIVNDKGTADVSRVLDSGSDADVEPDESEYTVDEDELAMAATQAVCPMQEPPTQPTREVKPSLTYDPNSDSESEHSDSKEKNLFEAETQAVPAAADSDGEDQDGVDVSKSLYEAETQAVSHPVSESEDDERDDEREGTSLYEAATQAVDMEDSILEDDPKKRVSIASTVMLNESSDLDSSVQNSRASFSPTKLALLQSTKKTPGMDESRQSFIFNDSVKKSLKDVAFDVAESEDNDLDDSNTAPEPFRNESEDTLPCDDVIEDQSKDTLPCDDVIEDQSKGTLPCDDVIEDQSKDTLPCDDVIEDESEWKKQPEHSIRDKEFVTTPDVPQETNSRKVKSDKGRSSDIKVDLIRTGTSAFSPSNLDSKESKTTGTVSKPNVLEDSAEGCEETAKECSIEGSVELPVQPVQVGPSSLGAAPTVRYELGRGLTDSSTESTENPVETMLCPIETMKVDENNSEEGHSIQGGREANNDDAEETQAYGMDDPDSEPVAEDEQVLGNVREAETDATQPYGGDEDIRAGGEAKNVEDEHIAMETEETQAYGDDLEGGETQVYGEDPQETQVPDSQEDASVREKTSVTADSVFAEPDRMPSSNETSQTEVDAAPQRRKSGDEGILKRRRSSQSLKSLDTSEKGGVLKSLKKKVWFGKKSTSSSSTTSSRSSSRGSRSSTGSGDEDVHNDLSIEHPGKSEETSPLTHKNDLTSMEATSEEKAERPQRTTRKRKVASVVKPVEGQLSVLKDDEAENIGNQNDLHSVEKKVRFGKKTPVDSQSERVTTVRNSSMSSRSAASSSGTHVPNDLSIDTVGMPSEETSPLTHENDLTPTKGTDGDKAERPQRTTRKRKIATVTKPEEEEIKIMKGETVDKEENQEKGEIDKMLSEKKDRQNRKRKTATVEKPKIELLTTPEKEEADEMGVTEVDSPVRKSRKNSVTERRETGDRNNNHKSNQSIQSKVREAAQSETGIRAVNTRGRGRVLADDDGTESTVVLKKGVVDSGNDSRDPGDKSTGEKVKLSGRLEEGLDVGTRRTRGKRKQKDTSDEEKSESSVRKQETLKNETHSVRISKRMEAVEDDPEVEEEMQTTSSAMKRTRASQRSKTRGSSKQDMAKERLSKEKKDVSEAASTRRGRRGNKENITKETRDITEASTKIEESPDSGDVVTRSVRSRGRAAKSKIEDGTFKSNITRSGQEDEEVESNSSTLSLDSGSLQDLTPTPSRGRRERRGNNPKVVLTSPNPEEEVNNSQGATSLRKGGRKATREPMKVASTPVSASKPLDKRNGKTASKRPKVSSPKLAVKGSPSLRRRSSELKPKVMFTGVIDKSGEKVVSSLGGELVDSVFDCTHLVTDKVRRTVKFLCCLSRGALIVTPEWLTRSKQQQMFVDAKDFILTDKEAEKQHKFKLTRSCEKARECPLLSGWKVHTTASIKPEPSHMKDIVRSAGGEILSRVPCQHQEQTVVISCQEDAVKCLPAIGADIPIVTAEFLLTGLLRQEINLKTFRLQIQDTSESATPGRNASSSRPRTRKR